jgi:uncharacterized repeat protein (TIGR03806 family)
MKYFSKVFFLVASIGIAVGAFYNTGCNTGSGKLNLDITKEAFATLAEYNLFKGDIANLIPNDGLVPYDLNTPLFSDYAEKARFVFVPTGNGTYATYTGENGLVDLPVGSVLVKNFFYPNDFRAPSKGRRIVETRLLIHREKGWDNETYVWNEQQTDAKREVAGSQIPFSFINKEGQKISFTYQVPNKNQCGGCHEVGGKITPIGPKVGNLDKDYHYADGVKNQLAKWVDLGIIKTAPAKGTIKSYPVWNKPETGSLDSRARAWLDINCAHCHNPKGPAKNSGLDLTFYNTDATAMGVGKYPIAAGRGAGDRKVDIDPGHPENSILTYRLESTDPGVMMPELGRSLVHTESVALIKDWIAQMKPAVE